MSFVNYLLDIIDDEDPSDAQKDQALLMAGIDPNEIDSD